MTSKTRLALLLITLTAQSLFAQDHLSMIKQKIHAKYPSLKENAATDWIITDQIINKRNGVIHVYLRQTYDKVEIFNANVTAAIKNDRIVSLKGRILQAPKTQGAMSGTGLSPENAIQHAAGALGLSVTEQLTVLPSTSAPQGRSGSNVTYYTTGGVSLDPIPVKKVFLADQSGNLQLCWDLSIYETTQRNWWSVRIDASTGELVEKSNWVTKCTFDTTHETTRHGKNETADHVHSFSVENNVYRVFPFPLENPNDGGSVLGSDLFDGTASPFGWHDTDGIAGADFTITRGNNVHAYDDIASTNTPGYSPDGGTDHIFDFPYSINNDVLANRDAAITNLFYANNRTHDIFYHYGFDEVSGNFQANNYGHGGSEGDYVRAEAQDGSGQDNANFATPPDGFRPRMQMFLWNPVPSSLVIDEPSAASGEYPRGLAQFGPILTSPIGGEAALALADGSSECCSPIDADIAGKIAVIDRGTCTFERKVKNAQDAGAIAVLIIDNVIDTYPPVLGDDKDLNDPIIIPAFSLRKEDGERIKAAIADGEHIFINLQPWSKRDASVDNSIIIHEYGHGISNRLTGGPANVECLTNSEQMGEGWSDYFALMLTMKEGDTESHPRGIATFSLGEPLTGDGIRPARYATDMAINNYTYDNVKLVDGRVHHIGFIWCTMLWEMTWKFINRYGFDPDISNGTSGNNIALQLVIDGLKLQPCGPGFVDGRDAILLADQLNNNGANQDIIWEAFAKRGLGASADQGDPDNSEDGIAAFDLPADLTLAITADKGFTSDSEVTYSILATNVSANAISGIRIEDIIPAGMSYVEGSLNDDTGIFENGKLAIEGITLESGEERLFEFKALPSATGGTRTRFFDDAGNGLARWNAVGVRGSNAWHMTTNKGHSGSTSLYTQSTDGKSDQILILKTPIDIGTDTKLSFYHSFYVEHGYDGGVVEISTNGGLAWQDLGPMIVDGNYNTTIDPMADSPLAGRQAFSGYHRSFQKTTIDLGSFAGPGRLIRFRSATDEGSAREGWYIDDIYVHDGDEVEVINEACATTDGGSSICAMSSLVILDTSPFVASNIPDQHATPLIPFQFTFDKNTFMDSENVLTYSATLTSGSQLPEWLSFDNASRTFEGTPGVRDNTINVRVTATDSHGGSVADDFVINIDVVTTIEGNEDSSISVFPNPCFDLATVRTARSVKRSQLYVTDLLGRRIAVPMTIDTGHVVIDLSAVPPGIYIVSVSSENTVEQAQLVKQ